MPMVNSEKLMKYLTITPKNNMNYNYYEIFEMKIVDNKYSKIIELIEKYFSYFYYKEHDVLGHIIYLPRWIVRDKKKEVTEKIKKIFDEIDK